MLSISPATAAELPAALNLIHSYLDDQSRGREVAASLADIARDPANFVVLAARQDGTLVGSALLELSPGQTAVLRGPAIANRQNGNAEGALVDAAIRAAANRDIVAIKSLLKTDSAELAQALIAVGFQHVTDTLLLVCENDAFPATQSASRLLFEPFDDSSQSRNRLAALISETYRDAQDCLGAHETRSMEHILADYRAVGKLDPRRWFFAKRESHDIGCLLLAEHYPVPGDKDPPNWELLYLGIIPEFRGNGYGIELVRFAQRFCKTSGPVRLALAVDAENRPARRVYAASGFREHQRRRVFVKSLGK